MASPAPPKHSSPRQTVHSPAQSDQSIMPTPKIAPTTINAHGLTSYRVWGVQERMCRAFYPPDVSASDSFTIGAVKILSSARELMEQRPWTVELLAALVGLLFGLALMPVLIYGINPARLTEIAHQAASQLMM